MTSVALMTKAPDDVLDYDVDFDRWLPPDDRLVSADSALVYTEETTTLAIDRTEFADRSVKVWLSGGADGETADVSIDATTSEGRTKQYRFRIRVREID